MEIEKLRTIWVYVRPTCIIYSKCTRYLEFLTSLWLSVMVSSTQGGFLRKERLVESFQARRTIFLTVVRKRWREDRFEKTWWWPWTYECITQNMTKVLEGGPVKHCEFVMVMWLIPLSDKEINLWASPWKNTLN